MNLCAIFGFFAAMLCLMPGPGGAAAESIKSSSSTLPHAQDPFVLSDSKKYFLFGAAKDGFECYESGDLVNWKNNGLAWRKSAMRVAKDGLRSPHVFHFRGMFYLVYAARMPGVSSLGLASSTQPQGPYHDVHVPWLSIGRSAFGANVFVDQNGKAYLTFCRPSDGKGNWVYGAALNQDLSRCVGEPVKLLQAEQRTESGRNETNECFGSACTFRIGSKYYLTYSVGGVDGLISTIGYATADEPLGPWTTGENNPLLSARSAERSLSIGQVSVFRTVDRKNWVLAYENAESAQPESGVGPLQLRSLSVDGIRRLVTKNLESDPR